MTSTLELEMTVFPSASVKVVALSPSCEVLLLGFDPGGPDDVLDVELEGEVSPMVDGGAPLDVGRMVSAGAVTNPDGGETVDALGNVLTVVKMAEEIGISAVPVRVAVESQVVTSVSFAAGIHRS